MHQSSFVRVLTGTFTHGFKTNVAQCPRGVEVPYETVVQLVEGQGHT